MGCSASSLGFPVHAVHDLLGNGAFLRKRENQEVDSELPNSCWVVPKGPPVIVPDMEIRLGAHDGDKPSVQRDPLQVVGSVKDQAPLREVRRLAPHKVQASRRQQTSSQARGEWASQTVQFRPRRHDRETRRSRGKPLAAMMGDRDASAGTTLRDAGSSAMSRTAHVNVLRDSLPSRPLTPHPESRTGPGTAQLTSGRSSASSG